MSTALIGPAIGAGLSLFGGGKLDGRTGQNSSSSSSVTDNQAYPMLSQALSPQVNNATNSSNMMSNLLGLNGGGGQNAAFDNWRNSTGYQFGMDQGTSAITGSAAAKGLLNSGSTAKALNTYGQNYANTQFGNYFQQLLGLGNQGNNAAGVIENAGQETHQQMKSSGVDYKNGTAAGDTIGHLLAKG